MAGGVDLGGALKEAFLAGVRAVDARRAVRSAVPALGLDPTKPVTLLSLGKAATAMAWGVTDAHHGPVRGVVATTEQSPVPAGLSLVLGSHPVPTRASVEAAEALVMAADQVQPDEEAVVLISGGGSSIVELPVPGVTIDDIQATTRLLLRSGAPIDDLSAVRTHLSQLKGGGLAGRVAGTVHSLVVSDVVGDRLDVIASGPTTQTGFSSEDALAVIATQRIAGISDSVRAVLRNPYEVQRRSASTTTIVASRRDAALGAVRSLQNAGLSAEVVDTELTGEARDVAVRLVAKVPDGVVHVAAGETTVTVVGEGSGGRNQEAALAAAIAGAGSDVVFLAAGTDGIDGTTTAAGALVDGATVGRAAAVGLDPADFLARNDSGTFFERVPGRVDSGPTGTNVGDLWFVGRAGTS